MQSANTTIKDLTNYVMKLDYDNLTPIELRIILTESYQCIKEASSFGGKVFGGFVREVVVPMLNDSTVTPQLKDIDLWFTTEEQADNFIASIRNKLSDFDFFNSRSSFGDFSRKLYYVTKYNMPLITLDIIVAKELPVDDFDVNTVTYSLNQNDEWITDSPNFLIKQIQNKTASMLPRYTTRIETARLMKNKGPLTEDHLNFDYYVKRINRILISRGWKICMSTPLPSDYLLRDSKIEVSDKCPCKKF